MAKRSVSRAKPAAKGAAIRVRMYRVGFGDFFLLTVPGKAGPQHILIDCGVHAGNIKSMPDCVADLAEATGGKLALVIVTHYHADHLSGFATQSDAFAKFEVDMVWITNRLDPGDDASSRFKTQLHGLAIALRMQLLLRLQAGEDPIARQALAKVDNALGVGLGVSGSANDKALEVVTRGFKNKPQVRYYEAGQEPELPAALQGALDAEVLGPAPKRVADQFATSDNKLAQYLAAAEADGLPDTTAFAPFDGDWLVDASAYGDDAFRPWNAGDMEKALHDLQPDTLAAAADVIDGTLNNQSLVVLFTCRNKKLLFVGDAQWGNWAYWLYGKPVKGKDPGITSRAKEILGSIDFYKVGHHGSTNATPIPAVGAMADACSAMCSTESGCYGSVEKKTEVPRVALIEALEQQTRNRLVRSDWIAVDGKAPANKQARNQLRALPAHFTQGEVYSDYVLPV